MRGRLFTLCSAGSLLVCVAVGALWVRTEALGRTDSIAWGGAGVYRCLEFSGDDLEYKVLRDPGFAATPLRWDRLRGGWARPPKPSNPAALPPGSVAWVMPSPASLADGQFSTWDGSGRVSAFTATSHRGMRKRCAEKVTSTH